MPRHQVGHSFTSVTLLELKRGIEQMIFEVAAQGISPEQVKVKFALRDADRVGDPPTLDMSIDTLSPPDVTGAVCSLCRRARTTADVLPYSATQVMFGGPLGWYSGDDGEVCPECMSKTLRGQR